MAQIPTLVTDDGVPLGDSTVICLHLNEIAAPASLIPAEALARQRMWRHYAVADGILEAQVAMRAEQLRPEASRSSDYLQKQRERIWRCFDALEANVDDLGGPLDLAQITAAIACGYQDWREWLEDFRPGRPRLADWYAAMAERPSLKVTEPKETPTG